MHSPRSERSSATREFCAKCGSFRIAAISPIPSRPIWPSSKQKCDQNWLTNPLASGSVKPMTVMSREEERITATTGFGQRHRLAREHALLTQDELAGLAEISKNTINAWEVGRVLNPQIRKVKRSAQAMGVSPRWLLFGEEDEHAPDSRPD